MLVFNTLSDKKQKLPQPKGGPLRLFVCGPTVYDHAHIGHARTYVVFDAFVRYLRSQKIEVKYTQNITDIDDKILERSAKENKTPKELARFFEKEYLKDMKALNVTSVTKYARASDYIDEIKKQIAVLIKKGFAYQTDSGVYFEVKKFPRYGQLSKQNLEELRPGWRIEPDPQKKDPLDFALWKLATSHWPLVTGHWPLVTGHWSFPSPWGKGRPGWHIEDTAISEKLLGPQYELHGAAVDLKFPHHESEIAQQESISGKKPFVKIWMHAGFLLVNGEKMSKSLGNFITIKDFLKKYSADVLRLMILSHHYRSPINYTERAAEDHRNALERVAKFMRTITINKKPLLLIDQDFKKALKDDFNTPKALAIIFEFLASAPKTKEAKVYLASKLSSLGFNIKTPAIPKKIFALLKEREGLRGKKEFDKADNVRQKIEKLGFFIED